MPQYVAFLRAINVGGRVVRMEQLRRAFETLGFSDVATFIASGNVIFSSRERNAATLERRIESALQEAFGYPVATFVRSAGEVKAIAGFQPFSPDPAAAGGAVYVIFLREAPTAAARKELRRFDTAADEFAAKGREVYWCRRGTLLESTVDTASMERSLGKVATTMRNRNTIVRLAAKLGDDN